MKISSVDLSKITTYRFGGVCNSFIELEDKEDLNNLDKTVFGKEKFKTVFPLITKDFIKMMIGLGASVGVVLSIHYIIVPNGL